MKQPSSRQAVKPSRIVGIDGYNKTISGEVSMTVTAKRSDPHHIPLVLFHDNGTRRQIKFNHAEHTPA